VVGSFSDGSPRFLWIDFSSERQDLRPVGTTEPPIEPPTKPPEPPIEPPTKPPKPPIEEQYYRVKEYKFMTPEIGAVRGPGNKFGRVTSAEAGKGMWGYYLVLFDRDTPDDDCWWEASKPDQYYQLQHTKLPIILGADSTEHSTDIPHEFYGKPISEGRGILESPVIIYDPIVGSLVPAYFCWPEKGTVGPAFAWVKR
jgi:hypothetical protein